MDIKNHTRKTNVSITFSATEKELQDLFNVIRRGIRNTPVYQCYLNEVYSAHDMLAIITNSKSVDALGIWGRECRE